MAGRRLIVPGAMPSRDQNGRNLPAALRFYVPGTALDTPATVYLNQGLSTPAPWPLESDAAGRFVSIWADEALSFDVVWSDQVYDRQLGAFSDVTPIVPAASADDIDEAVEAAAGSADAAETAQGLSEDARDASVVAQGLSEDARDASVVAQGLSEDARDAAVVARGLAEAAQAGAEAAEAGAGAAAEAKVAEFIQNAPGEKVFRVRDEEGNIGFEVTTEIVNHPDPNAMRAALVELEPARESFTLAPGQGVFRVRDEDGNVGFEVTTEIINHPDPNAMRSGLATAQSQIATLMANSASTIVRDPQWDDIQFGAEIVHAIIYGQSLSTGLYSTPIVSVADRAYGYRFNSGVRPQDGGTDPAVIYASLVALRETTSSTLGETVATACIDMIAQLLLAEDGIDLAATGQRFLVSAPGQSGKSSAELLNPADIYMPRLKENITYGRTRANGLTKSYRPGFIQPNHGEHNYDNNINDGSWTTDWQAIVAAVASHADTVVGSTNRLPVIAVQIATHLLYGRTTPFIALEQRDLCATEDMWGMATPCYPLEYHTDHLHLATAGERHLGAYVGLFAKRWLFDGYKPPLFEPEVARVGQTFLARFPVAPGRKLVFNTWSGLTNSGFTAATSANVAIPVTGVSIVNRDTVAVHTSSGDLPALAELRGGWIGDGYRGLIGIRDNSGDFLTFEPEGAAMPMHTWPIQFRKAAA